MTAPRCARNAVNANEESHLKQQVRTQHELFPFPFLGVHKDTYMTAEGKEKKHKSRASFLPVGSGDNSLRGVAITITCPLTPADLRVVHTGNHHCK